MLIFLATTLSKPDRHMVFHIKLHSAIPNYNFNQSGGKGCRLFGVRGRVSGSCKCVIITCYKCRGVYSRLSIVFNLPDANIQNIMIMQLLRTPCLTLRHTQGLCDA